MNPYEFGARWIGMKEKAGPANDPFVAFVNWFAGGAPTDDEAWCGAYMNFIAHSLGLERPELPRRARSWLDVGTVIPVQMVGWSDVQEGDVVILSRGPQPQPGPDVRDAPGHVGIYQPYPTVVRGADGTRTRISPGPGEILLLGGNQGDAVSIQAFLRERVLGVRRLRPLDVRRLRPEAH